MTELLQPASVTAQESRWARLLKQPVPLKLALFAILEQFQYSCSVSGMPKEALAVGGGDRRKGGGGRLQQSHGIARR